MNLNSDESHAQNTERQMLKAILDGDGKSWGRLSSELPGDRVFRLMSVATSALVFGRWPEDPTLEEIVAYVAEIVGRFPGDLPIPPIVIEAVIRGVLHEPELLDGIAGKDIVLAEAFVIGSMRYDVLHSPESLDAYISEVLEASR